MEQDREGEGDVLRQRLVVGGRAGRGRKQRHPAQRAGAPAMVEPFVHAGAVEDVPALQFPHLVAFLDGGEADGALRLRPARRARAAQDGELLLQHARAGLAPPVVPPEEPPRRAPHRLLGEEGPDPPVEGPGEEEDDEREGHEDERRRHGGGRAKPFR